MMGIGLTYTEEIENQMRLEKTIKKLSEPDWSAESIDPNMRSTLPSMARVRPVTRNIFCACRNKKREIVGPRINIGEVLDR